MSYRRLRNIVLKEWQVVFTDANSALIVTPPATPDRWAGPSLHLAGVSIWWRGPH